jgi:TRAP transporter TAXI family solute receptor
MARMSAALGRNNLMLEALRTPATPLQVRWFFYRRLVLVALIAAVLVVAAIQARPPGTLTIETGPVGGSYYENARKYQQILAEQGINLRIVPNPNSLQIVRNVADPKSGTDVGFVAQDVSGSQHGSLYTIGQIELQPLFVFASAEFSRRSVLDDLRGRRIVMPPSDSATSDAAIRVFQLYDITPENSQFSFMPLAEAAAALRAGRFDAGVFMLAPENPAIRDLTADSGLHLVPMGEVKAITSHLPFLRPVLLPRGIYNIADGIPQNNTPMVAAPVGIVVREGLNPYLTYALLEAMTKVHRGPTFIANAGDFPTIAGSQLPVLPIVEQYYHSGVPWIYRELPPWPASFIDRWQVLIFAMFLLGGLYICARSLADLAEFLSWLLSSRSRMRAEPRPDAPNTQDLSPSPSSESAG